MRDAADKLTYAYTDPQVLTDDWRAELTERFYREPCPQDKRYYIIRTSICKAII